MIATGLGIASAVCALIAAFFWFRFAASKALEKDATFAAATAQFPAARVGTLTITDNLNISGAFAPSSLTICSRTDGPLDARVPDVSVIEADGTGNAMVVLKNDGFTLINPAPGVVNKPVQKLIRRSNIITMGPPSYGGSTASDTSGTTYTMMVTLDTTGFDAVRLVYSNDQTSGSCVIRSCVAPSAQINDGVNPVDSTGATVPWVAATFNNSGCPIDLDTQAISILRNEVAPPSAVTSFTLPLGVTLPSGDIQTGLCVSDWIPCSSRDRSDVAAGHAWPLLMIRTYATGVPFPYTLANSDGVMNFSSMMSGGRRWDCSSALGDFVTTQSGYTGSINGKTMVHAVQFFSRSKGVTTISIGDSVAIGTGATGGVGYHVRAAWGLSTPQCPVTSFNPPGGAGPPGASPYRYWVAALGTFRLMKFQSAWLETSSRNWGYKQINTDMNWQMCMQIANQMEALGGQAIFVAPQPNASMTTLTEPFRVQAINRCSQAKAGGYLSIDPNPIVGVGTFPDAMKPFYSSDNVHMNDRGHDMMAALSIPLLRDAIGIT